MAASGGASYDLLGSSGLLQARRSEKASPNSEGLSNQIFARTHRAACSEEEWPRYIVAALDRIQAPILKLLGKF